MPVPVRSLHFADAREAEDLAAFLARLIHYDRAAAVRLQAHHGALAVFGHPPSFEVFAIRTARLGGDPVEPDVTVLDVTVSAGELLESLGGRGGEYGAEFAVPAAVTGPPWAGVLPPRGGWRELPGLPSVPALHAAVTAAVAEFRARDEALPEQHRTRAERDRIGRDIWSRTVGDTGLPLRAVHAAQSLGFLRPGAPVALLATGTETWLRLRTPFGSIAVRTKGLGGLSVTPTRTG
ncbi:hypothetical protein ACIHCQ_09285 [Streptomyces sp. NPDC052236]|uniref:hypothetical protein n=1 Tax=Streptomyces sp. NPDC052236 TaxID=3365686 RepID=UPI0037CE3048